MNENATKVKLTDLPSMKLGAMAGEVLFTFVAAGTLIIDPLLGSFSEYGALWKNSLNSGMQSM